MKLSPPCVGLTSISCRDEEKKRKRRKEKKGEGEPLPVMRTLKIYSLTNFPVPHTAVLALVITTYS